MTAKGKINASTVQVGNRIIVNVNHRVHTGDTCFPSSTKTGEGVVVTTVVRKDKTANRRGYLITTGAGQFYAEPIQTMWLAPEDPAGIKRAYAEALVEDAERAAALVEAKLAEHTEAIEKLAAAETECPRCGGPLASDGVCADDECGADEDADANWAESQELNLTEAEKARAENEAPGGMYYGSEWASSPVFELDPLGGLTLHSQGGKVDNMNNEADTKREKTGSGVVRLMERVHERIRQNHPEVPEVVIVTGRGIGAGSNKWGHFQAQGWTNGETSIHEMFMAGETLAKGAGQVLQTMLHESAHALAAARGKKDTSRQGRWHNAEFLTIAKELGLEYRHGNADSKIGFSAVTLTDETREEYADLLKELSEEIHLMVSLPGWLGGQDGDEDKGGENIGTAPKGPAQPNSSNLKLTCECEEPNIIRASRKVAEKLVIRCDECEKLFRERD